MERISRLYETAPIGPRDQPWFLNAVLRAESGLSAHDLLAAAKRIEQDLGRTPSERWGPRVIDIDLLLYGDAVIATHDLVVPHPELWNRRFVLVPLLDVLLAGSLADRVRKRLDILGADQDLRTWPGEHQAQPM